MLKNAIDWASQAERKSAPTATGGADGVLARDRWDDSLPACAAPASFTDTYVMSQPEIKIPSAASLFDASGNLTDENTRQHVKKFLEAFAVWIGRFKD